MFRQLAKAPTQVHIVGILQWKGLDIASASLVFPSWLGMNVPSKLFFGFVGDRLPKPVCPGGGMLLYAASMLLLIFCIGNALMLLISFATQSG
ncbi:MAG: hypothetical protein O2909_00010 [Chloroflexi bacterium]|nr:hypothetical protein [Chloroflexota bacterium]